MNDKSGLCLNAGLGLETPLERQLEIIKGVGFDAFFYDKEKNADPKEGERLANKAAKLGIYFHSIHAPFYGMDDVWHDEKGDLAQIMLNDLISAIDDCHNLNVPIVIMHGIIGMNNKSPNMLGIQRLEKVIDAAVKKNVTIAFENTENTMYLDKIYEHYGSIKNVGFCFDSGHELCYNFGEDMLGRFGSRLVSTHLNDNIGMTGSHPNFTDDAHLMPFDGIADWDGIAKRLNKCDFNDYLTFELNYPSRPGSSLNDRYNSLSDEDYIAQCYERAVKFRDLFIKTK